jgi:hypothetical protein
VTNYLDIRLIAIGKLLEAFHLVGRERMYSPAVPGKAESRWFLPGLPFLIFSLSSSPFIISCTVEVVLIRSRRVHAVVMSRISGDVREELDRGKERVHILCLDRHAETLIVKADPLGHSTASYKAKL